MQMTKSILCHMQKLWSLFPISLQSLPTFSFKYLSRGPPIAVSLISAVMLPCCLMSSYFAQSLWHIPLSPHQCLTLLMLGTIYLGIFLETSQAFIQLPCFASSSGPGTLSQVLNFVLGMCKNADSLNYRYMYQERRGEKGSRHHRLLQHSYFFWYRDQDQDFFSLVIWNYKFVWVHPPRLFLFFSYPPHTPVPQFLFFKSL